jgi:hypothetical protein
MLGAAHSTRSVRRSANSSHHLPIQEAVPIFQRIFLHRVFPRVFLASIALATLGAPQALATGAPTTTTLTVTNGTTEVTSVAAGTVVTLTATVVSGSTPVNPGQVKFCVATAAHCEDSSLLTTAQLTAAGTATYKFRPGIGSHSYQAVFVGTPTYTKSISASANLAVTGLYPTATTLASSGAIGSYTLTATVVGTGNRVLSPTGKVSFLDISNASASLGSAALGSGTLAESFVQSSVPDTSKYLPTIAVADFNGDGIPDLLTIHTAEDGPPVVSATTVNVFLGKGNGNFTLKSSLDIDYYPGSVAVGDFNGDGAPDLAVINILANSVTVLLGNGDGTFRTGPSYLVGLDPAGIAVGDFNDDGNTDIVVTNDSDNTLTVLLGKGDGTFTALPAQNANGTPQSVAVADFNGDGIQDVVVENYVAATWTVLLGNGDGTFTIKSTFSEPDQSIVVADFNGDGIPDLAGQSQVLLGKGDGTFTAEPLPVPTQYPPSSSVVAADFNGDGNTDLALTVTVLTGADLDGTTITLLLGKGDGTFTPQTTPNPTIQPVTLVPGDFNGDGFPDIAAIDTTNQPSQIYAPAVRILLNDLTQTAAATLTQAAVSGGEVHQIAASYPGDTNYTGSTSNTVTLLASKETPTLTLTATPNPSIYTTLVTLTATLSPYSAGDLTTDGETITFYVNGAPIAQFGTAQLASGVATITVDTANYNGLPVGANKLTAQFAGDNNFSAATSNTVDEVVNYLVQPAGGFVVTVNTDTTSGVPQNCATVGAPNCSLRDALTAATATGSGGSIAFDPVVFGPSQPVSARTISLTNGTLNIPPYTTITGPTTGSGATLANLVTVSGGGPVFTVNQFVTNTTISNLTITGGFAGGGNGGGIANNGALTVSNSTISGNSANGESNGGFAQGGGIANSGSLILINSTVTGNSASAPGGFGGNSVLGGGIFNSGTLTITNSTIAGNGASSSPTGTGIANLYVVGGGIYNQGTLTMTDSTVAGNSATASLLPGSDPDSYAQAYGGGIYGGVTAGANNIISGNTSNGSNTSNQSVEDDCDGSCPTSGQNGNLVGAGVQLTPLGNYGGPTQTAPPLPGSTAICAGVVADIPSGVTTDQRGFSRTATYGSNPPCVDSGSVQTSYSLRFSTEPPSTIAADANFAVALQLSESGSPFSVSGVAIPVTLAAGDPGSLNVTSLSTNVSGIASSAQLQVSAPGTGDKLVSTLQLTTSPPTASLTSPISINATSDEFNVIKSSQTISFGSLPNVSYGVGPITLEATASSGLPVTYTVTGPATVSGSTLTITGAGSVTVTASQEGNIDYPPATSVTQSFMVGKALLTVTATNVSRAHGTANPAFTYTISGFVGIDTSSVVSGTATETTTATLTSAVGTYPITFSTEELTATNYTFTYMSGTLTIAGRSQTTIASMTSTNATIEVFGFGFTPSSGQVSFTDLTSGHPVTPPVTLNTATATTSLLPQVTTSTGDALPVWTTLGDINSDGKLDLVTSLYLTDSVSVRLGNGDGTFQPATTIHISTGFGPAECHLVSLRGNGTLDLIVGSFNTNQIAVLLGNNNGTFENPVFYTLGSAINTPTSLTTGDFNHDGNLDVAVANTGDNTVSVLVGNGTGVLTPLAAAIPVGRDPEAIRAGDFNGDGYSDLAVANYADGTVTILLNSQDGTFVQTTLSVGSGTASGPQALAVSGSGAALLLAVANYKDNTISVMQSNGSGGFETQKVVNVGKGPDDVNFADFNGDGIPDLAVANYTNNTVNVVLGGSGGNYTVLGPFSVGSSPYSAAVGDLDLDGTPDLVVSNCFSNNTGVLLDGTQISLQLDGLSLKLGDKVYAEYAPDGSSKYGSSTSATVTAP